MTISIAGTVVLGLWWINRQSGGSASAKAEKVERKSEKARAELPRLLEE